MTRLRAWFALVAVTVLHAEAPAPAAKDLPLELPKFTTTAELGYIRYYYSKTDQITSARIDRLTKGTKAYEAGLREGCELVSINDQRVVGLTKAEVETLFQLKPEPGKPKVYAFLKRGLFRGKLIEVTFSAPPRADPAKP